MIEKKQDLLLKSLLKFYKCDDHLKQLVNIIKSNNGISLRIIDYLCTNYAKKCDVMYYIDRKRPFNLYLQYRSQLKAYSKMQFDPFRRHERITIPIPEYLIETKVLETTVAQLNFFKWAIENKVIKYLSDPNILKSVEKHMNTSGVKKETKGKGGDPSVVRKKVTSVSAKRHNIHVTVTFK